MVEVGQEIQKGDPLLVLEAMKMETEVRAPVAGTVASVDVKEGDGVKVGDTLTTSYTDNPDANAGSVERRALTDVVENLPVGVGGGDGGGGG